MYLSTFIAQVLGCYLFLVSLAMLVHQMRYKKTMTEFLGNQPMVTFSGMVWLIMGLLIIISHNVWMTEWPGLITVIGWVTIVQALIRIFFPEGYAKGMKELMAKVGFTLMCWIGLLVGLFLIWVGFSCDR